MVPSGMKGIKLESQATEIRTIQEIDNLLSGIALPQRSENENLKVARLFLLRQSDWINLKRTGDDSNTFVLQANQN